MVSFPVLARPQFSVNILFWINNLPLLLFFWNKLLQQTPDFSIHSGLIHPNQPIPGLFLFFSWHGVWTAHGRVFHPKPGKQEPSAHPHTEQISPAGQSFPRPSDLNPAHFIFSCPH